MKNHGKLNFENRIFYFYINFWAEKYNSALVWLEKTGVVYSDEVGVECKIVNTV